MYGEGVPGDSDIDIFIRGTWKLPEEVKGNLIGMNMAYDGWLILVTEDGYVIALFRDLSKYRTVKMALDEKAGTQASFCCRDTGPLFQY
ncbi:MAG: hypothetical protein DRH37_01480 [Deltaproteobacteria bacterium]|nr:MAG: hypothetical protein DRH37_01480 [Deltaproteobacteria bacterium]